MPMKGRFSLLLLLCFSFAAHRISVWAADSCVPYNTPYYEERCGVPAGTPIFIPDGSDADYLFGAALLNINTLEFLQVPEPCFSLSFQINCATNLRTCVVKDNVPIPLPVGVCGSLCTNWVAQCGDYWVNRNIAPSTWVFLPLANYTFNVSCQEIDRSAQDNPFWPELASNYSINGTYTQIPCKSQNVTAEAQCYSPLVVEGDSCLFTCPLPSLSDSQYENAEIMQAIVSWMAWAGGMILPTLGGRDEIWCGGQGVPLSFSSDLVGLGADVTLHASYSIEALTVHSSACSFQGAMILFGFVASTFWWAIIASNMALEIFLQDVFADKIGWRKWARVIIYHVLGWGIPFVCMVIPTAAGKIGFEPGATFCFILSDDNHAWDLTFFFIPVGLALLIGALGFFLSLVKLVIFAIKVRKLKAVVVPYIRILLFVFIFFLVFAFFIAYVINNAANEGTVTEGYDAYYTCLSGGETYNTLPVSPSTCQLSDSVSNYNLVMLKAFAVSCVGVLLSLTFFSWELIRHWYRIGEACYLCLLRRNTDSIRHIFSLINSSTHNTSTFKGSEMSLSVSALPPEEEGEGDVSSTSSEEEQL